MDKYQYKLTIRFFDAKGTIVTEKEYQSLKKPNNGTVKTFAKRNAIVYDYWIIVK